MGLFKGRGIYLKHLILVIGASGILLGYIQLKFNTKISIQKESNSEIWSHRGIHNHAPENSIESLSIAKSQSFKGVEIDVFYDEKLGLVVSHDFPYKLVNNQVVMLQEIIDTFYNDFSFWIDFKNLSNKNVSIVASELSKLFQTYPSLRYRLFVESANGLALRKLAKNNIGSILWVQYSKNQPKQFLKLMYFKALIGHSNFKGITTHYRFIDDRFKKVFRNFDWYVFTVNDDQTIQKLKEIHQTKVILTDLEGKDVFN